MTLLALFVVFVAGLVGGCGSDPPVTLTAQDGVPLRIGMGMRRFSVDRVNARVGHPVTFEFANKSGSGHEAFIGDSDAQIRHGMDRRAPRDAANTVEVGRSGVGRLIHTFDKPGDYIVGCHVAGHYKDGMKFMVHVT